jgi:hypothetical protein
VSIGFRRLLRRYGGIIVTDDDHFGLRYLAPNNSGGLEAVHPGHGYVHEHHVRLQDFRLFNGFDAVRGFATH